MFLRVRRPRRLLKPPSRPFMLFMLLSLFLLGGILVVTSLSVVLPLSSLKGHSSKKGEVTAVPTFSPTPLLPCQDAALAPNPVAVENTCPGTASWQVDHPTGPTNAIEAFTVPASVNVGESVKLYVSTTARSYTFQVYRMGWYGGLGGRLVYSSPPITGIQQPAPLLDPITRMVSCRNWHDPVTIPTSDSWVSGVYIVKLLSAAGYMRYTLFTVRNDASHSALLFQTSILTYQAYNLWGGFSLYRGTDKNGKLISTLRSYVVSFDRPYSDHEGLMDFVRYELNFLRWVERSGYDVSYTTDIDTDMHGALLLQHKLFLVVGHDEYWSTAMRQNVTAARDAGVSLGFFGANDVYWHVRLQSSPLGPDREVVCYKPGYYPGKVVDPVAAKNPKETTVLWRAAPLNMPENTLMGEMYGGIVASPAPLVLSAGAAPLAEGTGLHVGSVLPGLVNGEYDRVYHTEGTPSSLTVLASSPLHCQKTVLCPASGKDAAQATLYTAASGAKVFDAGTWQWSWGLDDERFDSSVPAHAYSSVGFQAFNASLISYLLGTSGGVG